jgi:hypothetical protein
MPTNEPYSSESNPTGATTRARLGTTPVTVTANVSVQRQQANPFDTNGDGVVDRAAEVDSVAWANITGRPNLASDFTGDSGSGGTNGLVPAPASGTGGAKKALLADGTWGNPKLVLG